MYCYIKICLTYIDVSVHGHFQINNPMESIFGFAVRQIYASLILDRVYFL